MVEFPGNKKKNASSPTVRKGEIQKVLSAMQGAAGAIALAVFILVQHSKPPSRL